MQNGQSLHDAMNREAASCFWQNLGKARALCRNSENISLVLFVLHPFLSLCREALLARLGGRLDRGERSLHRPFQPGRWAHAGCTGAIPLSPPHPASELLAGLCQTTCVSNRDELGIDAGLTGHQPSPLCPPASQGHRYHLSKGAQQPRQRFHGFFAAASPASLPF